MELQRLALIAALLPVVMLTGSIPAQDARGGYPLNKQDETGCWSPVDFGKGVPAPATSRRLRVTALVCLAIIADKSTMRSGPYKKSLTNGIRWLRTKQDDHGRFDHHTEPDWILDHTIASYAIAEACLTAAMPQLRKNTSEALRAMADHLSQLKRAPTEVLLWSQLTLGTCRHLRDCDFKHSDKTLTTEITQATERVESEILRLLPKSKVITPRDRLALLWLRCLRDPKLRDKGLANDVKTALTELKLIGTERPLESFYLLNMAFLVGYESFKQCSSAVGKTIRKQQTADRSWEPEGEFGRTSGRLGTTAVHLLTLLTYYRYSVLATRDVIKPVTQPKK